MLPPTFELLEVQELHSVTEKKSVQLIKFFFKNNGIIKNSFGNTEMLKLQDAEDGKVMLLT